MLFVIMLVLPKDDCWMPRRLYSSICNGSVAKNTKLWEKYLWEIENEANTGKDLYLKDAFVTQEYWYPSLGITKEWNQGNTCVAQYYGLKSVQLQ